MGKHKHHAKTFNDLEERFQWQEGLDPDHIFDAEKEMIVELRSKIPQLEKETDKFVAVFLFARRHDLKETTILLHKFYKTKEQYVSSTTGHIPSFKYTKELQENSRQDGLPVFEPKGYRDVHGRMVRFLVMARDEPQGRDLNFIYTLFTWQAYYLIYTEPLNAWRNGIAIVLDLKNVGWKNFDFSAKGRELSKAMQGTFPIRIRGMFVINTPLFFSALYTAAKFVLPKKLIQRIKLTNPEELKAIVPEDKLPIDFGGTDTYTFESYYKEIAEIEEELFAKGIWKAPDGASTTTTTTTTTTTAS